MNDAMNELTQFSPLAGELVPETVSGVTSKKIEYENDVTAVDGADRTMYAYAPRSGCPDPKQCQVLMVLRDGSDEASARRAGEELGLFALSEEEHFLLLFPNPAPGGWNYDNEPERDSDADFLNRCFGALRGSRCGVNGFNGMIFYLSLTPAASALMMTMAAEKPLNVPAMMIGPFPEGYRIPAQALHVEAAAYVSQNPAAVEYLRAANGVSGEERTESVATYFGNNPNVRLLVTERPIDAASVRLCWDRLFCETRRWQNDTYGAYQRRTRFTERGFTAHVKDSSLGVNGGFAHTWYEYVPPKLRGTKEPAPLVFYFHGVNCVPLYGAEQSNFHNVADREGFIVVYPAPAKFKAWNIFNDPALPSDFDFVLALIGHMDKVHPIDRTRIYATGFSMGGMMTHAICGAYPEVFAAAAPCNAFNFAYFKKPREVYAGVVKGADPSVLQESSAQRRMADAKKAAFDYRMPMIQNAGCADLSIGPMPMVNDPADNRLQTVELWKRYNNIPGETAFDPSTPSGLAADESFYDDPGERFFHQRWHSADPGAPVLYELVCAKRMPHAIDPVQIEYAWEFIRKFRRLPDGPLEIGK